jgi:hypothetical protein
MTSLADACRASARQCSEIADSTRTFEDRVAFLTYAASWQRLATEIESNERLLTLIDELASSTSRDRGVCELSEHEANANSLRRLAAAIVSVSNHFLVVTADPIEDSACLGETG